MATVTRDDVALHLLAQLPDDVRLTAPGGTLARAYGIEDRLAGPWIDPARPFAELVDELGDARPAAPVRGDDGVLAGHRIAIVTNVPMHYRVPLFTIMARRLESAGAAQRVFFLAGAPARRPWVGEPELHFEHEVLGGRGLRDAFDAFAPTLVVAGGFGRAAIGAALYARRRSLPFGVWSGAIASTRRERGRLRRLQRRRLLRHASFGIAYGIAAREYLRTLRPALPVAIARNTSVPAGEPPAPREPSPTLELLILGRLDRRKGVDVALEALRLLPELACRLTVVGDGPEREALAALAARDGRVRLAGALPPADARAAYGRADVFLFPTRDDVFGHVLVEAMSAGLPVAVAAAAGATADLCVDGRNALVVPDHRPETWAAAIARLAGDAELRQRLGERAAATVQARWTLEHSADAMVAGLRLGALVGAAG